MVRDGECYFPMHFQSMYDLAVFRDKMPEDHSVAVIFVNDRPLGA